MVFMAYTKTVLSNSISTEYVRRVYLLLTLGIVLFSVAAYLSVTMGQPVEVTIKEAVVMTPPLVAWGLYHPIVSGVLVFAFVIAASVFRKAPVGTTVLFPAFTIVSGIFTGPLIFLAQYLASKGETVTSNPVRDASVLTVVAFAGLSSYATFTKKDFSVWEGSLISGLFVLIGASLLNIFLGSNVLDLALCSVTVILFSGFILVDTQKVMRESSRDDAVGDAMNLFLDFLNLFTSILRLLMSSSFSKD
jgi:modulator of FtsH protease